MIDKLRNLFEHIPAELPDELVNPLWQSGSVRVERIVSFGHVSPPNFWYDSDSDEWVLLLGGAAKIRIEGGESLVVMKPGDQLLLAAHTRHRVEWTEPNRHTIWLAVYHKPA